MYTITVANHKGGVGKSTLVLALASGLHRRGFKVLVVDMDGQGNTTSCFNASKNGKVISDVLKGEVLAKDVIIESPFSDIIPANISLRTGKPLDGKPMTTLKNCLLPLKAKYDFCIIDTPPDLNMELSNAFVASDGVIVPMLSDIFSIESLDMLMMTFEACKQHANKELALLQIVVSMYDGRAIVDKENLETIQEKAKEYNTDVSIVRKCAKVKEAQNLYIADIFDYSPKSNATSDYNNVINKVLEGLNHGKIQREKT